MFVFVVSLTSLCVVFVVPLSFLFVFVVSLSLFVFVVSSSLLCLCLVCLSLLCVCLYLSLSLLYVCLCSVSAFVALGLHVKYLIILSELNKCGFCGQILVKTYNIKFHGNPSCGSSTSTRR